MSFAQPPLFIHRLTPSHTRSSPAFWRGRYYSPPPPLRSTSLRRKILFFFLFLSFYSLSSLRALMGPFSLSLAFLRSAYRLFRLRFSSPSVFLGNARAVSGRRSSFEPRVSSRLECVYLFSLIMDPLEEEEEERKGCRDYRSANSSGDDWDLGWRSRVASMNCRHCGIFFSFSPLTIFFSSSGDSNLGCVGLYIDAYYLEIFSFL